MDFFVKPHIKKLRRYQTSIGRDLDHGIRLDRNEKVSDFSKKEREIANTAFNISCLKDQEKN